MAEKLSIRERVEREIVRRIELVEDIGQVRRWHVVNAEREHLSALVIAGAEERSDESMGNAGLLTIELAVAVELCVARYAAGESASQAHTRWAARLMEALFADQRLTEGGVEDGPPLALYVRFEGCGQPPVTDDQPEAYTVVSVTVVYQVFTQNPYAGPGVDELEA